MIRRLILDKSGVSTLEFGLLVPILIMFIVGGADYGLAMFKQLEMRSAARAGAQHAILSRSHDSTNIQSIVENATNLTSTDITVTSTAFCQCVDGSTVTCGASCDDGSANREFVTVTVAHTYVPLLLPTDIELSEFASVRFK
jgi:Flp pilus assembly protein TadG